jgi:CDP-glycerol glycerophosphotransferase (TagB/SpsB family)
VPTFLLQQGLQVDDVGRFFIPLTCNKMAVWGPSDKRYMKNLGVDEKRLVITGSPIHDNISTKSIDDNRKQEIIDKLNLDKNKKTVLLISQAFEGITGEVARESILDLLVSSIKDSKDEQLIIKLHPREEEEIPRSIMEKYNPKNVVLIKKEFNVTDLLGLCDVMITVESTCIYDAILLKKPVISVNLVKFTEQVDYVKSHSCIGVYKKDEFRRGLEKAYNPKSQKEFERGRKVFVRDYFYKVDNMASKRVAKLINKMIEDKRKAK